MSVSNDSTNNSNNSNNTCIVCYKNVEYYSIGMCEHPVCYECSTRMRVLCQQNECPICRQDLPKVVFTKEIKPFRLLRKGDLLDMEYNIYFSNREIQEEFNKLLKHVCNVCENNQIFSSFDYLKDHMKRKHNLRYCELCIVNLRIFSRERRCYTSEELLHHELKGDLDDKSHRGHPLCKFCEQRYMDIDELYRHLRRDHLFCHYCDADGLHHYYNSYDYLRKHFQAEHHLCEEGDCVNEQFTSVFRTDIDLRVHKATVHGKHLGKAAAKQARTLELEFTLAPRGDPRNRRGPPGATRGHYGDGRGPPPQPEPTPPVEESTFNRQPLVDVQSTQEFPRLGNASASPSLAPSPGQHKGRGNFTICGTLRKGNYDENFPALGPESAATPPALPKTLNVSVSSTNKTNRTVPGRRPGNAPNLSIHVNHRPNGTVTTRLSGGPNLRINSGQSRNSDFPALGSQRRDPPAGSSSQSWTKITCVKSIPATARGKKVAPPPLDPSPPPLRSGEDFPSLSKPSKTSGRTSVRAPSSWLQVQSTDTSDSSSLTADATKGKAKKKKMKQQTLNVAGQNGSATTDGARKSEQNARNRSKTTGDEDPEHPSTATPGTVSVQRKRSELKIENLNAKNNNLSSEDKTANNASRAEDFPLLGSTNSRPPGLASPPPGFEASRTAMTTASTSPGFLGLNGLTFTNSSGESYTIVPDETDQLQQRCYAYQPPDNFQRRNQNLIAKFNDCFGPEDSEYFKTFRHLSRLFRSGDCNAAIYYDECRTVIGAEEFRHLFPELLALLPDIEKQRELYDVHMRDASSDIGPVMGLTECANCGQILLDTDIQSHASSHSLENEFPALGKSSLASTGAWSRK